MREKRLEENINFNASEEAEATKRPNQARAIFDNIYEQLKPADPSKATETGKQFVSSLEAGVEQHIAPIEKSGETNQQIYADIKKQFTQTAQENLVRRYLRDKWYKNKQTGGAELEWAKAFAYDTKGDERQEWWNNQDARDFFQSKALELASKNAFQDEALLSTFIKDRPDLISRFQAEQATADNVYNKLSVAVNDLVRTDQVGPMTAKVFLRTLPSLKYIGDYNAVIRNDAISSETLADQNIKYRTEIEQVWNQQPAQSKHDQDGGFYQFNSHFVAQEGHTVKNRVYVSADLTQAPEEVVKAWMASLDETGLRDRIYFKFPTGLSKRFESIVVYQTDQTSEADMENLLTAFIKNCPPELLNQRDMSSSVPLRRGISMALEPANINKFLECYGIDKNISYNELVSGLAELAFEMSLYEARNNAAANTNPSALKERAAVYFDNFIRLAGINPETMVPNSQGGKLPLWAERVAA